MAKNPYDEAADRLIDLCDDRNTRQYIIGYLLHSLNERYWDGLVLAAEAHSIRAKELHAELRANAQRTGV